MTDLPLRAVNLARRVMQILANRGALTVTIMVIDGRWYAVFDDGKPEKLG